MPIRHGGSSVLPTLPPVTTFALPELRIARGHFDLPCRARTGLYRRPEGVRMFRRKRREKILRDEARQTQERFERNERAGKELYARMAELKNVPRENLPDAVALYGGKTPEIR